jgi:serine/threonine protein kinase
MKKQIPEEELWELIFQCMQGLVYIHNQNIIHRDIKPANLFMTDNKTIKIGDFGVSAMRKKRQINYQNLDNAQGFPNINSTQGFSRETLLIGTPLYMSPEMYNHKEYGSKVDVYAMGCTFYEMCFFSPPRIPIPIMSKTGEIITDLQDVTPKQNMNVYSNELVNLIKSMIEKDQNKRPSSNAILDIIRQRLTFRNSSISCVFRCFFTFKKLVEFLKTHLTNINDQIKIKKPISLIFLFAFDNDKKNNYENILNYIRSVLSFNNLFFEERDEIEPEDLIDFIIKRLHIENNKIDKTYSRVYTKENDRDIFDHKKIFDKYAYNLKMFFKSKIFDQFYGTKEAIKTCLKCQKERFYIESFYYLKFDANEVTKHFSNSNNFILDVFKKESNNYVKKEILFCPNCKVNYLHKVNKKIIATPSYLIISLDSEEKDFNTQNLKYPLTLNIENFGIGTYYLNRVIKKTIQNGEKFFICIYREINNWFISDGFRLEQYTSPLNHNIGNVVMLFYSNED